MKKQSTSKYLKLLKILLTTLLFISITLFLSIKLFWLIYSYPKYDKKETELFLKYKDSLETTKDYILETFDEERINEDIISIHVSKENKEVVSLYHKGPVEITNELKFHFNTIQNLLIKRYDFSFIDITKDRISYGGLGYRMYVYSRNGKAPTYFYFKGDGMHPEVYKLDDNWYLLTVNYR